MSIGAAPRPYTLYSAGYSRLKFDEFCDAVERERLVVADVRLKPVSRQFIWNKNSLAKRLGAGYTWIPELGNLNYKGGPIQLQAESIGLAKLLALLVDQSVVMICVCADPRICHRTVIATQISKATTIQVRTFESRHAATAPALF